MDRIYARQREELVRRGGKDRERKEGKKAG